MIAPFALRFPFQSAFRPALSAGLIALTVLLTACAADPETQLEQVERPVDQLYNEALDTALRVILINLRLYLKRWSASTLIHPGLYVHSF